MKRSTELPTKFHVQVAAAWSIVSKLNHQFARGFAPAFQTFTEGAVMHLVPIAPFLDEIQIGSRLRFGVRGQDGSLLLAKGFIVESQRIQDSLVNRGVFVDMDEFAEEASAVEVIPPTPLQTFISTWGRLHDHMDGFLRAAPSTQVDPLRIMECVSHVISLCDSSRDLLLFLILRHDQTRYKDYGVFHSLHVAATCGLIARRLKWSEDDRHSLVGAALTMNMAMTELQGQLATEGQAPTDEQREHIHRHPLESAARLRQIGITDGKWLAAVEQHHETSTGSGYPGQLKTPTEMSQVLRYIDMFIAKLSARATRLAELPNVAARQLFTQNHGDPLAAVVIKEFGIYPPGCYVKLASGELAIVTRGGAHAHTPVVAALTNADGHTLEEPSRRDTSEPQHAIEEIIGENLVFIRPAWSRLHALSFGHSDCPVADMSRVAI